MPRNFGLWISISSPVFVGALSRHENIIDSFSMKILETMLDRFRGGQLVQTRRRRLIAVLEKWGTRGKFFSLRTDTRKTRRLAPVRLIFHIKSVQREFSREKQSRALVSIVHRGVEREAEGDCWATNPIGNFFAIKIPSRGMDAPSAFKS